MGSVCVSAPISKIDDLFMRDHTGTATMQLEIRGIPVHYNDADGRIVDHTDYLALSCMKPLNARVLLSWRTHAGLKRNRRPFLWAAIAYLRGHVRMDRREAWHALLRVRNFVARGGVVALYPIRIPGDPKQRCIVSLASWARLFAQV